MQQFLPPHLSLLTLLRLQQQRLLLLKFVSVQAVFVGSPN